MSLCKTTEAVDTIFEKIEEKVTNKELNDDLLTVFELLKLMRAESSVQYFFVMVKDMIKSLDSMNLTKLTPKHDYINNIKKKKTNEKIKKK